MNINRCIAMAVALVSVSSLACQAEAPYDRQENVVYADVHGIGLVMDLFVPSQAKNGLGIVIVTSGGWSSDRGKIRDLALARVFDIFCSKGYTVFAVRPGSVTKFSVGEMVENTERGIRWIKQHGDAYQIDTERLGLMGASAGGHLASLLAVNNGRSNGDSGDDASVAAVGVFFPPTDFLDYGGKAVDVREGSTMGKLVRRLAFGGAAEGLTDRQIDQRLAEISPARRATGNAPPFLMIHGDADLVVPLQQSTSMVRALEEKEVPVELLVVKGGGHPWPTIHKEVAVLADWFDKQLMPTVAGD